MWSWVGEGQPGIVAVWRDLRDLRVAPNDFLAYPAHW